MSVPHETENQLDWKYPITPENIITENTTPYGNAVPTNHSIPNTTVVGFSAKHNEHFEVKHNLTDESHKFTLITDGTHTILQEGINSCYEISNLDWDYIDKLQFWVEGVLPCVVAVSGILGNAITAFILLKANMRNSFNFLLIALAVMDSCFLIGAILESFRKCFFLASYLHIYLFPYFLYPGMNIAVTCSIIMTVGIALERYIAVHYPIEHRLSIDCPEASRRRLAKYILSVIIISVAINIPKFFESKITSNYQNVLTSANQWSSRQRTYPNESINTLFNNSENSEVDRKQLHNMSAFRVTKEFFDTSILGGNEYGIEVTSLRKNPEYTFYYSYWTRLVVMGVLPIILLIYFNYKIYKSIKKSNHRQRTMSTRSSNMKMPTRKKEYNLAIVFMGIAIIFLVCHTPRNILSLVEVMLIKNGEVCKNATDALNNLKVTDPLLYEFPTWIHLGTSISHLMLVINSSTNIVLYTFLDKAFRKHFSCIVKLVIRTLEIPFSMCRKKENCKQNKQDCEEEIWRLNELKDDNPETKRDDIVIIDDTNAVSNLQVLPRMSDSISQPTLSVRYDKVTNEEGSLKIISTIKNEENSSSESQLNLLSMVKKEESYLASNTFSKDTVTKLLKPDRMNLTESINKITPVSTESNVLIVNKDDL